MKKITLEEIKNQVLKSKHFRIVFLGDSITSTEWVHPNQLGNAYLAKIILEKGIGINFNSDRYIQDTLGGMMYPRY